MKFLDKETGTLGERIRTLFKEQGITIVSILTALGMTIESFHPRDRLHNNCYYPPYWCTTFSVQQQHKIKY